MSKHHVVSRRCGLPLSAPPRSPLCSHSRRKRSYTPRGTMGRPSKRTWRLTHQLTRRYMGYMGYTTHRLIPPQPRPYNRS
jgi:hypothetical protein